MRTVAIVQARMGSTRLPGKTLLKLDRKNTILDYVVQQISHCTKIDKIVIATTTFEEDNQIEEFAMSKDLFCFRGDPFDVLDRYYQCAKLHSLSTIVRITADNPLIDPNIVDLVISEFQSNQCDCATNTFLRTFPYGTEVEVFSFDALKQAWKYATKKSEKEHVTLYFYKNPSKFKIHNVTNAKNLSTYRLTIDQIEDFILVQKIINKIHKRPIYMIDIINLLMQEPELININKNVKHKLLL